MQAQQQFHPFASQYNLPPHIANWRQGQPIPQGWRLGRKGYLKPTFTLPSNLASWQQGQPLPQGYRLNKRGTLRPVNYFQWWQQQQGLGLGQQQFGQQALGLGQQQFQQPIQTNVLPAEVELRQKPAVVQEIIKPGVREEIQPVIHREREQLEIREEIQPIYEKSVRGTVVEQRQLAPEIRPEVRVGQMPIISEGPRGSTVVEAEQRQMFVKAPIVEEVVHKKIVEEVQPVIHREVIAPKLINERKDIYEKIVEAPTVSYTTLPPKYAGGQQFAGQQQLGGQQQFVGQQQFGGQQQFTSTTTTTTVYSGQHPYFSMLPSNISSWQQGQPIPQGWRLGHRGYLKPIITLPPQYSSWQQGQPIPQGFRLNKQGSLRPINTWEYWNNMNKLQQQQQLPYTSFAPTPVSQF